MIRPPLIPSDVTYTSANVGGIRTYNNINKSFSPWKDPVEVTSMTNITRYGPITIDSVSLVQGNRVLLQGQTSSADNGIYIVQNTDWIRSYDMLVGSSIDGVVVYVKQGTYAGLIYYSTSLGKVGTDGITFNVMNNNDTLNIPLNYIVLRDGNGFIGYESLQYFEDSNNCNLILGTGSSIDSTITTSETTGNELPLDINSNCSNLEIMTNSVAGTSGNVTFQTGDFITNDGSGGDITITTGNVDTGATAPATYITTNSRTLTIQSQGDNTYDNNIYFENAYVSTSNTALCKTTLGNVLFGLNRIELPYNSVTIANFAAGPAVINNPQGVIIITDPSSLVGDSVINLTVNNNVVTTGSLVKTCIKSYAGTGLLTVDTSAITNLTSFVINVTNVSIVSTNVSPLQISYWIL